MYNAGTAGPYTSRDLARKNVKFIMKAFCHPSHRAGKVEAKQRTYRDIEL